MGSEMRAQGATEYLVLLAVVLIVALVSVALLGFFPGMASDAQYTQSQTYWSSAQPIAITESLARASSGVATESWPYFRFRNSGAYPIRITGLIGSDGIKHTQFVVWTTSAACGTPTAGIYNITDFFYMAPGEEKYMGWLGTSGQPCEKAVGFVAGVASSYYVGGATSLCTISTTQPGMMVLPTFGFEYIEYLDNNQQITKRQIGAKPLVVKCRETT